MFQATGNSGAFPHRLSIEVGEPRGSVGIDSETREVGKRSVIGIVPDLVPGNR